MKEITRKQFMGGMAATVALGWRGGFAAPARRQRNYDDMTWWDPYVENITDADTYLRRKFRQDVTDNPTGVGVEALKKILAEIVASGKAGARSRLLAAEGNLQPDDVMVWLIENDGIDFLTKGAESMGKQRLLGRKAIPMAARAVSFYCSPDAAAMFKGQKPSH